MYFQNVDTDEKGHIDVDEFQNTSRAGIYAVGDVCGRALLTPGMESPLHNDKWLVLMLVIKSFKIVNAYRLLWSVQLPLLQAGNWHTDYLRAKGIPNWTILPSPRWCLAIPPLAQWDKQKVCVVPVEFLVHEYINWYKSFIYHSLSQQECVSCVYRGGG